MLHRCMKLFSSFFRMWFDMEINNNNNNEKNDCNNEENDNNEKIENNVQTQVNNKHFYTMK
jgi:hypothetical protein